MYREGSFPESESTLAQARNMEDELESKVARHPLTFRMEGPKGTGKGLAG